MIYVPTMNDYKAAGFSIKEIFSIKKSIVGFSVNQIANEFELRANEDIRYLKLIQIVTIPISV